MQPEEKVNQTLASTQHEAVFHKIPSKERKQLILAAIWLWLEVLPIICFIY